VKTASRSATRDVEAFVLGAAAVVLSCRSPPSSRDTAEDGATNAAVDIARTAPAASASAAPSAVGGPVSDASPPDAQGPDRSATGPLWRPVGACRVKLRAPMPIAEVPEEALAAATLASYDAPTGRVPLLPAKKDGAFAVRDCRGDLYTSDYEWPVRGADDPAPSSPDGALPRTGGHVTVKTVPVDRATAIVDVVVATGGGLCEWSSGFFGLARVRGDVLSIDAVAPTSSRGCAGGFGSSSEVTHVGSEEVLVDVLPRP
jgi:hypothetical protein